MCSWGPGLASVPPPLLQHPEETAHPKTLVHSRIPKVERAPPTTPGCRGTWGPSAGSQWRQVPDAEKAWHLCRTSVLRACAVPWRELRPPGSLGLPGGSSQTPLPLPGGHQGNYLAKGTLPYRLHGLGVAFRTPSPSSALSSGTWPLGN